MKKYFPYNENYSDADIENMGNQDAFHNTLQDVSNWPKRRADSYKKGVDKLKRKKNPEHEIRELILFAENSPSLHDQYVSIMKNLSRKQKRGVYDNALAAKLWRYWIDEGVKQYNKEILGGGYSLKQTVFTIADRKQAAVDMEEQEREEVFSLEYLENPRTRRKTKKKRAKKRAKKNPRKKTYFAFLCWLPGTAAQGQITYAYITDTRAARVGITATKRDAAIFQTKARARAVAQLLAENWPGAQAGVAPTTATAAQIRASCKKAKV